MQFAEIILPLNLPGTLTYGIPVPLQNMIQPGMRVEVNMGRNKIYAGVVFSLHNHKPDLYQVKPIKSIIDKEPVVSELQLKFWMWIAQYYMCHIGEVMQAALPSHLKLMSESLLIWSEAFAEPPLGLSDNAFILAEALHLRKQLTIGEVRQLLDGHGTGSAINELLEQNIAIVTEILEEKYKEKSEKFVLLHPDYHDEAVCQTLFKALEKSPKQLQILMIVLQQQHKNPLALKLLLEQSKSTSTQVMQLAKKGVLLIEEVAVDRLALLVQPEQKTFELTVEQAEAYRKMEECWQQYQVALLHGVTGSGKTMLYMQQMKEVIANGGQVLFLLPEIALTTQIVSRLRAFFGEELGVYHSRFTQNERVEIWNKVKQQQYKIVVGARSAVWLPFIHLQLVIVDEEHETSYKQQEPAPRFHARDAAIFLATLYKAKVLLGSATPSVESILNAQNKKYGYIQLGKRFMGAAMPQIEIVSFKNTQSNLSPILTANLLEQIAATTSSGKQVILFQNKRGYAPFLLCGSCGWVAHCKNCDVSLTYHKATDRMHCHYCGSQWPVFKMCPKCQNMRISSKSFGTERIEEELQRIFPKLKIARLDWDSVRGKNKMNNLLNDFAIGRIDILVGTQMIVKGLDFDNVGLVGILSADSLLSWPDFRVNERGYQLMEQVSGRAGRSSDGIGKVIIQGHKTEHPVLQYVQQHDFRSYYQSEILERQQFGYPPFSRMIKLTCKHRDISKAEKGIVALAEKLSLITAIHIQGPAPALVPRLRNYYLFEIRLKMARSNKDLQGLKMQIAAAVNQVLQIRGNSSLQIAIDVDPY